MIGFELKLAKKRIEKQLQNLLENEFSKANLEVSGFEVDLQLKGVPEIEINNKTIQTSLPVFIELKKDAALFSLKGHGELYIIFVTDFDINPSFQLTTKSSIRSHKWISDPVIDFGKLDITVEKLVNLIINHYNDSVSSSLDKAIKDNISLQKLVSVAIRKMKQNLSNINYYGISIFVEPTQVLLEPFKTENGYIHTKGALRAELCLGSQNQLKPEEISFTWVENLLSENLNFIKLDVSEQIVSNILCDFINQQEYGGKKFETTNCEVDFKPGNIAINLSLSNPIAGEVKLNGFPSYNEANGELIVNNLDIDVSASNFIYKLTAPLINNFLKSKINNHLPVRVNEDIKNKLGRYFKGQTTFNDFKISHQVGNVELSELYFKEESLNSIIKASDVEVSILLENGDFTS